MSTGDPAKARTLVRGDQKKASRTGPLTKSPQVTDPFVWPAHTPSRIGTNGFGHTFRYLSMGYRLIIKQINSAQRNSIKR